MPNVNINKGVCVWLEMCVLIICLGHRWLQLDGCGKKKGTRKENHVVKENIFKAVKIQNVIVAGYNLLLSLTQIGPSSYVFIFWNICHKSRSQTPVNSVVICCRRFFSSKLFEPVADPTAFSSQKFSGCLKTITQKRRIQTNLHERLKGNSLWLMRA